MNMSASSYWNPAIMQTVSSDENRSADSENNEDSVKKPWHGVYGNIIVIVAHCKWS